MYKVGEVYRMVPGNSFRVRLFEMLGATNETEWGEGPSMRIKILEIKDDDHEWYAGAEVIASIGSFPKENYNLDQGYKNKKLVKEALGV